MYVNYNDYELVYLVRDGNNMAKEFLFKKYTVLIKKIYREGYYSKRYQLYDFIQEGLLILEKVIYSYDFNYQYTFYSYFTICFIRRLSRLKTTKDLLLCESPIRYKTSDIADKKTNNLIKIIEHSIMDEDDITKLLIKEVMVENSTLKSFCLKYNFNYKEMYILYRKIRLKLEKILTN